MKRTPAYALNVCLSRGFLHAFWDFRTAGDHHVPLRGGCIVASTHQSHLDPWILQASLTRRVRYVARKTLFRNRILGAIIGGLGAIPFDRDATTAMAMKALADEVEKGEALAFFPEGTRSHDGEIGRLRPGISLLIRRTRAPVVPVAIEGTFDCWPRHQKVFRPGRVRIVVGRPLTFERRVGREAILSRLSERLHELRQRARQMA